MAFIVLLAAAAAAIALVLHHLLSAQKKRSSRSAGSTSYSLPPGDLGVPVIGQTFSLLHALRSNTDDQWFRARIKRYGPVSKMSVLGSPTVLLAGTEANHFIFTNQGLILTQTRALRSLLRRSILTLTGDDLKQVRSALQGYLRPEMVRGYVGKMDAEVRRQLKLNWVGRSTVNVLPMARSLTLGVICSVVFGEEAAAIVDALATDFQQLGDAILSFPVNIPFTRFGKGMRSSAKIREAITKFARKKEEEYSLLLSQDEGCTTATATATTSAATDFVTYMLLLRSRGAHSLSLADIVDNVMGIVIGAHGTTSTLITFMVRHLANEPDVLAKITQEQDEIAGRNGRDGALTWEDVSSMKYTWRAALETLRTVPPVFGSFRTATKDIEYQGYLIPKGWKVFASQSITHMDPRFFAEPTKFDPSRFEKRSSIPPYSFLPFGGGPRMCPGTEFSRVETMVAMHYLVTRFRWKLRFEDEAYNKDPKPTPVFGCPVELELRKTPAI
ncbi:taxane 10-beta-hydroxylase [Zea mays]|uniref:Putative cytochrome P450 superfamily protein n=1 Tax=Zea mays TaxID=4577 RepID=K7UPI7_MAIZE|nr:taxane 10-beta-hydroxylase [Zea mays]AQK48952.1 Putative cytochrome P450 superfamily protein [Zea mays]